MLSFQANVAPSAGNDMELPLDERTSVIPDDKRVVSLDDFRRKKSEIPKSKK
jgi:hypothetical protein